MKTTRVEPPLYWTILTPRGVPWHDDDGVPFLMPYRDEQLPLPAIVSALKAFKQHALDYRVAKVQIVEVPDEPK